jgi:sugar/nucleoside kinase (ribokinase family)
LNTIRVAQRFLAPGATVYVGAIGVDSTGETLEKEITEEGVRPVLQKFDSMLTGQCGVLIYGGDRSLIPNMSAAKSLTEAFVRENWNLLDNVSVAYASGYVLGTLPSAVIAIAKQVSEGGKKFALNISATFLATTSKASFTEILPFTSLLFGNAMEATALAD